jgi:hypothetical protein
MKNSTGSFDIKFIVVHQTATKPGVVLRDMDKLPYHYIITKSGKLLNLNPVKADDFTIEVALSGGMDSFGNHMDGRTEAQKRTLFSALAMLAVAFPEATIVGADELYVYGFPNPGFNVQKWMAHFIDSLIAA